jgi:hypothetical protein
MISAHQLAGVILAGSALLATPVQAAPAAATICPPFSFPSTTNLASNPSFEKVGPNGSPTTCPAPCHATPPSAAASWNMHSSNPGDFVSSRLEATTVPAGTGPSGLTRMLHIVSGGNEGGVFQILRSPPQKIMFQVWVYVRSGHVVIVSAANPSGPAAWSTKKNQWEELRVCTDGTVDTNFLGIFNEDPAGGDFFIDRVEARKIQ